MAKVISLECYRERKVVESSASDATTRDDWGNAKRDTASSLINRAVDILFEIGEKERKIAWILEDCIDLLLQRGEEAIR